MAIFNATSNAKNPEEARIDGDVARIKADMNNETYSLGRHFYEANMDKADQLDGWYQNSISRINTMEYNLVVLENQRLKLKGLRKCDKCACELTFDSAFCNRCGEKQEPVQLAMKSYGRVCANCGAELADGSDFCTKCGTQVVR